MDILASAQRNRGKDTFGKLEMSFWKVLARYWGKTREIQDPIRLRDDWNLGENGQGERLLTMGASYVIYTYGSIIYFFLLSTFITRDNHSKTNLLVSLVYLNLAWVFTDVHQKNQLCAHSQIGHSSQSSADVRQASLALQSQPAFFRPSGNMEPQSRLLKFIPAYGIKAKPHPP